VNEKRALRGNADLIAGLRRIAGSLSDLAYLVVAAVPALQRPSRWWARRRYRALAAAYHRTIARDPHYFAPLTEALGRLPHPPRLAIDVAAGTGAATALLRARYPDVQIVAVDHSEEMLATAAVEPGERLARVIGDAFRLPLVPAIADLVVTSNAPFSLRELVNTVRPGGAVIVALSSAAMIPAVIRWWCVRRAMDRSIACEREITAGVGVAWIFRHDQVG
jgi:SAM-dependent methyltransferase